MIQVIELYFQWKWKHPPDSIIATAIINLKKLSVFYISLPLSWSQFSNFLNYLKTKKLFQSTRSLIPLLVCTSKKYFAKSCKWNSKSSKFPKCQMPREMPRSWTCRHQNSTSIMKKYLDKCQSAERLNSIPVIIGLGLPLSYLLHLNPNQVLWTAPSLFIFSTATHFSPHSCIFHGMKLNLFWSQLQKISFLFPSLSELLQCSM